MKTVECPVTGGKVDGDTCFRIVLVVDGEAPQSVLPDGIVLSKPLQKACRECPYHADLDEEQ